MDFKVTQTVVLYIIASTYGSAISMLADSDFPRNESRIFENPQQAKESLDIHHRNGRTLLSVYTVTLEAFKDEALNKETFNNV